MTAKSIVLKKYYYICTNNHLRQTHIEDALTTSKENNHDDILKYFLI